MTDDTEARETGDLKPCPFCGEVPEFRLHFFAHCLTCDFSQPGIVWQTRPSEDALRARIAALEARCGECDGEPLGFTVVNGESYGQGLDGEYAICGVYRDVEHGVLYREAAPWETALRAVLLPFWNDIVYLTRERAEERLAETLKLVAE